jgi:light-harvesting protein B-800-850 alpha chain
MFDNIPLHKIWLVIKPSIGLPLLFGGVLTIALLVHLAILTSTTWYPNYYQGNAKPRYVTLVPAAPAAAPR